MINNIEMLKERVKNMRIGIYGSSTQTGGAFLVDFIVAGHDVYGYARKTDKGMEFTDRIIDRKGIMLERFEDGENIRSRLVPLGSNRVGHDVYDLVEHSDIIVIAHPSQYIVDTIKQLNEAGIAKKRIPIILGCSRTIATPYIWNILGEAYPVVCFSTSPYSAKAPAPGTVFIKRRKRNWMASLEGEFKIEDIDRIKSLFPQVLFNRVPATTSLGNIGAIFHVAPYVLNYDEITERRDRGEVYSFYMEGIAEKPDVGRYMEAIDQTRLHIAYHLGLSVFGCSISPREQEWKDMMNRMRSAEEQHRDDIEKLRILRQGHLQKIGESIVSAQHWLDYTYGVTRIAGESLSSAIGRTPTYQKMSVPQSRYLSEDIPTGLVPLEALAKRFGIDHEAITYILDLYDEIFHKDSRAEGRNLEGFSTEYLRDYLVGIQTQEQPLSAKIADTDLTGDTANLSGI
ncbi:MAG TPA: hypothetical protein GXX70_07190 [Tepidimicrobium sp.]|nr:hypothetical protein [Tepidimicrobium sp.]